MGEGSPKPRSALCTFALVAIALVPWLVFGASAADDPASAISPDSFKVGYYDVATSASASGAGYGGLGFSGGAGDNTVRIVNPTSANGTLCALIYVFDDREAMQACCGCPVSSDGMRIQSAINDLTSRFGVTKANLNAGVIKVISSQLNFTPGSPSPAPLPPGTNGAQVGNLPLACSPTGSASNDPFKRATAANPTAGLRVWITHDELLEPGAVPGGKPVQSTAVEEFLDSPLDATELSELQHECANLIINGSGVGTCTCGDPPVASELVIPRPTPSPTPTPTPTPTLTPIPTPTPTPTLTPTPTPTPIPTPTPTPTLTPTPTRTPTPTPTPTPPKFIGKTFADTTSSGANSLTLTLPSGLQTGEFLLATVAIQGTGAGSATITIPSGWIEIRHDSLGSASDFQMSIARRSVQPGDTSTTQFVWSFEKTYLGSGGVALFSNVGSTPIEAVSFAGSGTVIATAPSITTTKNKSLDVLVYGTKGNGFLPTPSRYLEAYQHNNAGSGPDISNDYLAIPLSGTITHDQLSIPTDLGNIGYQIGLSPLP